MKDNLNDKIYIFMIYQDWISSCQIFARKVIQINSLTKVEIKIEMIIMFELNDINDVIIQYVINILKHENLKFHELYYFIDMKFDTFIL